MAEPQKSAAAPVAKTHQEIVDAIERLYPEYSAIYKAAKAEIDAQRAELQRQCGDIGHLFAKDRSMWGMGVMRSCLFYGMNEPKAKASHG